MTKKRKVAYLALLINVILWGVAPPLVKLALPHTTPFRWLFYRYLFAAPLALPFLIFYLVQAKLSIKTLLQIIGLELIGTTAVLAALYEGLKLTSAIEASLITATAPVFVTIGGILFLKEKEERNEWIGLALALAGTILIALEPILTGRNQTATFSLLGNGLILLQNILWAMYLLMAKKVYKKLPKLMVTSISFWVGLISFWILSLSQNTVPLFADLATPIVATSALYMAVFGSIIALTCYIYAQNVIEASEATLFGYLQPLVSIPLAIWWLNDRLQTPSIIAMVIIAIGVFLAESRPGKSTKASGSRNG